MDHAMIQINTNTQEIINKLTIQLGEGLNTQRMMQRVAVTLLPVVKKRVHEDGLDAEGRPIGNYSTGYMAVRTGKYKNSDQFVKGAKAGKNKNSGTHSKGKTSGRPRPVHNRTADTKVILSLTREMENDMTTLPTEKGYALGYQNPHNLEKAQWCEATYGGRKILTGLTDDEMALAQTECSDYVDDLIKTL
jgi:phage gpG-like protein